MEQKLRTGVRIVKRNARNAKIGVKNAAHEIWANRSNLPRTFVAILLLCGGLGHTHAGSQTVAVVTHSESCIRGQTGLICTIQSATTLTLLPAGQSSSLLLKDEHGIALGQLTVTFQSLQMECLQKSEAWMRSYHMKTLAVKHCPRAGSCRGAYCDQVRSDTMVPGLKDANPWPGHTFCLDSSSFWHNQCGLPAAACLFYRWYAQPLSRQPFEVISCPSWDVRIKTVFKLESSGGKTVTQEMTLHPGLTSTWGNITVMPLAFSIPPSPVLSSKFITDGRSVALVDRLPDALHCADEDSARRFNCSLSIEACKNCIPDHDQGLITCHCQDTDLEGIMENPMARLPLTVARVHLLNQGPAVFAEHPYSPIQLHIEMKNLRLILEFRDSKCWVEPINLQGCYKCATGAQLAYRCRTDWGTALAKIECADGTLFATQCTTNGTDKRIILPFDSSLINTVCTVDCPAGETVFNLSATLHYIPLGRQFGHQARTSEYLDEALDDQWQWPFDLGFDPMAIFRLWANLPLFAIFLVALIIGAVILYFVVKFSPAYRAYRLIVQMLLHQNGRNGLARMAATAVVLPQVRAMSLEPSSLGRWQGDKQTEQPIQIHAVFVFGLAITILVVGMTVACCRRWWKNRRHGVYRPQRQKRGLRKFSSQSTLAVGLIAVFLCAAYDQPFPGGNKSERNCDGLLIDRPPLPTNVRPNCDSPTLDRPPWDGLTIGPSPCAQWPSLDRPSVDLAVALPSSDPTNPSNSANDDLTNGDRPSDGNGLPSNVNKDRLAPQLIDGPSNESANDGLAHSDRPLFGRQAQPNSDRLLVGPVAPSSIGLFNSLGHLPSFNPIDRRIVALSAAIPFPPYAVLRKMFDKEMGGLGGEKMARIGTKSKKKKGGNVDKYRRDELKLKGNF